MKRFIPIVILMGLLIVPATANAQFNKTWKNWHSHVAGGLSGVKGDASNILKDGWNISGGATYKPRDWRLGIILDLGYNDFDMKQETLDFFGSTGGDASITSFTLGGIWATKISGRFGFNLQAGLGGYYIKAQLKEPSYICDPICDPYYSWWCQWGCVPGEVITDSASSTEFGYSFGAAITFEFKNNSVIYLEARYHSVDTQVSSKFMPVVIGYRW